jgi:hypothetical protein
VPDDAEQLAERIRAELRSLSQKLDSIQADLVQGAQAVGFMRRTIDDASTLWATMPSSWVLPQHSSFLTSTGDSIGAIGKEVDRLSLVTGGLAGALVGLASTSTAIGSGTMAFASAVGIIPTPQSNLFLHFPGDTFSRHAEYQKRFSSMDPALGRTYGELIELINATRADPYRAAMFMARQLFDHFFDAVASDPEVRAFGFWKLKTPDQSRNPDAVFRAEKIAFAAAQKIPDATRGATLLSASAQTLSVYEELNRAHTRGVLKEPEAKLAVESMIRIIQQWMDSIA